MPKIYEFAIKKETLNSGKDIFTPVVRRKAKKWMYTNEWDRITCIYGKYTTIKIDWNPELTYEQCDEHIKGYQQELLQQIANNVAIVEFHNLENKEI